MTTAETLPATDTRDRLIGAAIEVFLEHGYARTRVQDIARRAGLTTGAMYAHFENKGALLSEAIAISGDSAMGQILDAIDGRGAHAIAVGVNMLSGPTTPAHRLMLEALAVSARGNESEDVIGPTLERMREMFAEEVGGRSRSRVARQLALGRSARVALRASAPRLDRRQGARPAFRRGSRQPTPRGYAAGVVGTAHLRTPNTR